VSPLSRDRTAERDLTCLSLFAHGDEISLKGLETPAVFLTVRSLTRPLLGASPSLSPPDEQA